MLETLAYILAGITIYSTEHMYQESQVRYKLFVLCFYFSGGAWVPHAFVRSFILAGTTYGAAKEATIVPVKVLSSSGSGSLTAVLNGLQVCSPAYSRVTKVLAVNPYPSLYYVMCSVGCPTPKDDRKTFHG